MQAQKKTCAPAFQNVKRQKNQLKRIQERAERIILKQQKKLKCLRRTLKQVEEEARKTEDYCEATIVSVIDSLQRHFMSVKKFIGVQEQEAATQVQLSLKSLQAKKKRMKKRRDELKRLAQMDNDVSFTQEWTTLHQLCEKDLHCALHDILEEPHMQFEFTKRAVDEFGRQLKKLCEKDITSFAQSDDTEEQQESEGHWQGETGGDVQQRREASSSQSPGLPGIHSILNVEPTTRDEFLQYACSLTFDPATAHEDLVISAGNREVRLSPLWCNGPVVRCPQRFICRKQLLCRQALQAPRCYYEVEVEGDKAEIALTYKGIDRKSLSKLSAFGGNDKSWSLDRSKYYSVSHRGVSEQLSTPPAHRIIGVYLQFREGLLSFYEVSDTMTLLHKVEARFTEPLYPGFWLGEKCCIRICDLR